MQPHLEKHMQTSALTWFWGGAWTLGAWCELRSDFRSFRLDRIVNCTVHDTQFADTPGRRLADYLRAAAEN
jgi:predicted DNA-binding transcriptional regulator YafY